LIWRLEAKAFSRPLVNLLDDLSNVFITQIINVFSLWDVLPDQTICVFVEASFPGVVGVREEAFGGQLAGDLFMVSKFSAIVVGQGENPFLIGLQVITDRIRDSPRCFIDGLGFKFQVQRLI
jgi:hypothetical protein